VEFRHPPSLALIEDDGYAPVLLLPFLSLSGLDLTFEIPLMSITALALCLCHIHRVTSIVRAKA